MALEVRQMQYLNRKRKSMPVGMHDLSRGVLMGFTSAMGTETEYIKEKKAEKRK